MQEYKSMNTLMNIEEMFTNKDITERVDEIYFMSFIGCLLCLTTTKPYILNVVSVLSRFMHCASETHLKDARRVLKCIKGTTNFALSSRNARFSSC